MVSAATVAYWWSQRHQQNKTWLLSNYSTLFNSGWISDAELVYYSTEQRSHVIIEKLKTYFFNTGSSIKFVLVVFAKTMRKLFHTPLWVFNHWNNPCIENLKIVNWVEQKLKLKCMWNPIRTWWWGSWGMLDLHLAPSYSVLACIAKSWIF